MEKTRICKKCKRKKPISDFYPCYAKKDWYRRECKQCTLLAQKEYALEHRAEKAKYLKKYNKKNRIKIRKVSQARNNERLKTDLVYKAKRHARLSIWKAFNKQGKIRESRVEELVGCSSQFLTIYLKQTWADKYGSRWIGQPCNIDHIKPLVDAQTEGQVVELCHYTNLRLVTPEDNFKKGLEERKKNERETARHSPIRTSMGMRSVW